MNITDIVFSDMMSFQFTGLVLSVELCLSPAALPDQWLEPEQHAGAGQLGAESHYS